jgi:hypothetical protein
VIAPDGTVYLGTTQGKLIALHADGKLFWSRDITRGQSIVASPAIASDGSVYVIGVERIRDNRVKPPKETYTSTLHRFTSSGGWLAQIPFPVNGEMGPAAVAPPPSRKCRGSNWVGGGLNPPAIGPQGHVYAIASNILFVFPPPIKKPKTVVNQPQGGLPVATNPGAGTLLQQQSYKPPMTANGNRLFACEELDGDDCGKGDHKDISLAWCEKEGYPQVKRYDVDSKKVKAETLDGRFCSKNKCKVFDQIVCTN